MNEEHVISLYQAWEEDRLDTEERREIQRHLTNCEPCREYFEKMSTLLDFTNPSLLPHLEADPFLPTRIRAIVGAGAAAREGNETTRATAGTTAPFYKSASAWLRVSLAGVMTVAAVTAGVYLGSGLASSRTANGDTAIVTAYYEAVSQSSFAVEWGDVIEENGEDQQ
jgi:anti-sigma factor RsiW